MSFLSAALHSLKIFHTRTIVSTYFSLACSISIYFLKGAQLNRSQFYKLLTLHSFPTYKWLDPILKVRCTMLYSVATMLK